MYVAANFKSNLTRTQVQAYSQELESYLAHIQAPHLKVSIFPSHTALLANDFAHFQIGAQNAHYAQNGAFTGEITLKQLAEFNICSLIIGHSERRMMFNESQEHINEKFAFYKEAGFSLYYCIGEPLNVRKQGENALKDYLSSQLSGIALDYPKLIIAYEPIWAIGTGVSASMEEIASTHAMLSTLTSAPLLYGGSVNASNAKEILSLKHVHGVLVGSASLELESFKGIIQAGL